MKIICFDIGGTNISKAVVEIEGESYNFLDFTTEPNPKEAGEIEQTLVSYADDSKTKFAVSEIAISAAGIVGQWRLAVSGLESCYGKDSFRFTFLKRRGFKVKMENDGRCFAMGEFVFGKSKGKKSVLSLAVGTGIGGGFLLKGKSLKGAHHSALEVGHMKIQMSGNDWMDWEQFAAGKGIALQYQLRAGNAKSTHDIFESRESDPISEEVIESGAEALGVGIANLINIFDPEFIVIGGGISKHTFYIEKAFEIAQKHIFNREISPQWAISELKRKANILGAASLF